MSDVFISYSRRDIDFVHRLHAALTKLGRETWIDWRDIAPTSEWASEVFAGIEAADNFVFVVSPHSVVSSMCMREMDHAITSNKRIVPLVRHPVETQCIPPGIAGIQWISFEESTNFELAFASLIRALDTDLEWIRIHTRILLRASEWERHKQDTGFVLRGIELQDALGWLARSYTISEPRPLPLQVEYVQASQEWEAGEILRLKELIEEKESQRQAALARQLAAQSELVMRDDPGLLEVSGLLAVEAIRRCPLFECDQAIRRALALLPTVIGGASGGGPVDCVWFRPDGDALYVQRGDGVSLLELAGANEAEVPVIAPSEGGRADSVDGHRAVWGGLMPGVLILEGETGKILARLDGIDSVRALAWSHDGLRVATGGQDGAARVFETQGWKEVSSLWHRDAVSAVAFSPDGFHVATGSLDRTARIFEADTGREVHAVVHGDFVDTVAFSPDGRLLASGSWDRTARVTEVTSRLEVLRLCHRSHVQTVAFSADNRRLATGTLDGHVRACTVQFSGEVLRLPHESFVSVMAFSPEGARFATGCDGKVRIFDLLNGREMAGFGDEERVASIALSRHGRFVAFAGSSNRNAARVFDTETGMQVFCLLFDEPIRNLAISEDGRLLAVGSVDKTARVFEIQTGKQVACALHDGQADAVAFSRDGRYVASGSDDQRLRIFEAEGGKEMARVTHNGRVYQVAFSADGSRIATGGSEHAVRVFAVCSGEEISAFGHQGDPGVLAFSPDGLQLLSGSFDKTARVSDVASGRELSRLTERGPVQAAVFASDGRSIMMAISISAGRGRVVMNDVIINRHLLRPADLVAAACSRLSRGLTAEEWKRYLGDEPYRTTCSS